MTDTTRAIDMWAPIVPTPDVMSHVAEHFPKEMAGYLRVFSKREPRPEEFRAVAGALGQSEEQVIEGMDAAGIEQTLITGFDEHSSVGETFVPNHLVVDLAERHPTASSRSPGPTSAPACARCASWSGWCATTASEGSASARS